jgi:hypothetical protein
MDWAGVWATRIAELHEALDAAPPAAGRLVGAVLAPRAGWPQHAALGQGAQQHSRTKADSQVDADAVAAAMDALAAALAAQLGAAAVFMPSSGDSR